MLVNYDPLSFASGLSTLRVGLLHWETNRKAAVLLL